MLVCGSCVTQLFPRFTHITLLFGLLQVLNSLQPGVAFLYPLKTFSGGIEKQHRAVMG